MMKHKNQSGSALVYILIAIAMLALLTATFMDSAPQQGNSQKSFELVNELNSQIQFIRSAIQECVLTYPNGDTTMPPAPALVGGQNIVRPYPLQPANGYMLNPVSAGLNTLNYIRCPGNPGNSNDHARIFGGTTGKFPPKPPALMNPAWIYYNGPDGVFVFIGGSKKDAYLKTALQKLDAQFSKCEADFVDALTTGPKTITSDGWAVPNGEMLFRVWLVIKPSALYPDEPTCPASP